MSKEVRYITQDMLIPETDGWRLKVQDGSASQTSGTEFQATQLSTAALSPSVMQLTATDPIDITSLEMTVSLGGVNVQIFEASAGTAGGTFTAIPLQTTNLRNPRTPTTAAAGGGTFTPTGAALRQMAVSTSTSGANILSNTRN